MFGKYDEISAPSEKKRRDYDIDWENIFAMFCLLGISYFAMEQAQALPPVVNTIAGGFIGYLTRARQQVQSIVVPQPVAPITPTPTSPTTK